MVVRESMVPLEEPEVLLSTPAQMVLPETMERLAHPALMVQGDHQVR